LICFTPTALIATLKAVTRDYPIKPQAALRVGYPVNRALLKLVPALVKPARFERQSLFVPTSHPQPARAGEQIRPSMEDLS
jgi:hypothetical protein